MKRYLIFLLIIGCGYTEKEPLDDQEPENEPASNQVTNCSTVKCPTNSHCFMQNSISRCQCDSGYILENAACIKPINESTSTSSNQCTANTCVSKSNSHCVIMDKVPYCQCNDGYQETNKICVKTGSTPTPTYKIFPGQTKAQVVSILGVPNFTGTSYTWGLYYCYDGPKCVCFKGDTVVTGCDTEWGYNCDPSLWDKC